jgi:pyridoxamine 5'-phosphate oxidase
VAPEAELRDAWLALDPPADPLPRLRQWLDEARADRRVAEPDAATLATVDGDGRPSARIVLVRALDVASGAALFYTDRASRKGRALAAHPFASLVFYWDALARQVRLEGAVTLTSDAESDAYFASRHPESRLGAWASEQSEPIASRDELVARYHAAKARLGDGSAAPRPPNWGGYRLWIERIELWVSRPHRLHDRVRWERTLTRNGDDFRGDAWRATRLMP